MNTLLVVLLCAMLPAALGAGSLYINKYGKTTDTRTISKISAIAFFSVSAIALTAYAVYDIVTLKTGLSLIILIPAALIGTSSLLYKNGNEHRKFWMFTLEVSMLVLGSTAIMLTLAVINQAAVQSLYLGVTPDWSFRLDDISEIILPTDKTHIETIILPVLWATEMVIVMTLVAYIFNKRKQNTRERWHEMLGTHMHMEKIFNMMEMDKLSKKSKNPNGMQPIHMQFKDRTDMSAAIGYLVKHRIIYERFGDKSLFFDAGLYHIVDMLAILDANDIDVVVRQNKEHENVLKDIHEKSDKTKTNIIFTFHIMKDVIAFAQYLDSQDMRKNVHLSGNSAVVTFNTKEQGKLILLEADYALKNDVSFAPKIIQVVHTCMPSGTRNENQ